jgi:hypothetical protein
MLTEAEMTFFADLWAECLSSHWGGQGPYLEGAARFLEEYERRTGFRESNPKAFLHHLRVDFGPICEDCGKPLRTPRASKCMECGAPRRA